MENLRSQIEDDERELARLSHSQREARQLREHNEQQGKELNQLEMQYASGWFGFKFNKYF